MPFDIDDLPTLHRMQDAVRRIDRMMHDRACREYGLAFGNPDSCELNMCVIHNSLVSRDYGKPWGEVNYHHMRRANWIIQQSHKTSRLIDSWYRRKCGIA